MLIHLNTCKVMDLNEGGFRGGMEESVDLEIQVIFNM